MNKTETHWISLSDMMTGLMLVFLLIAILSMQQIEQTVTGPISEYVETRENLYRELNDTLKTKYDSWDMVLGEDLSIKFENPDVLFGVYESTITPHFQNILDEFVPIYIKVLNQPKYADQIKEVRIEGHTAYDDDYFYTIDLSQDRSNAVLETIFTNTFFQQLTTSDQRKFKFWLTSNGMGQGRTLDDIGNFTYESGAPISPKSRRVEFKIVTKSQELIEEINKLAKK